LTHALDRAGGDLWELSGRYFISASELDAMMFQLVLTKTNQLKMANARITDLRSSNLELHFACQRQASVQQRSDLLHFHKKMNLLTRIMSSECPLPKHSQLWPAVTCAICKDDFQPGDVVVVFECKHI
jgi:hypothetical protein